MRMIMTKEDGLAFLDEHTPREDVLDLTEALFIRHGTQSGQPAVLLVSSDSQGRRVVTQVTLNMLIALTAGMRGRAEMEGWTQPL
jgi:hypothetical protein